MLSAFAAGPLRFVDIFRNSLDVSPARESDNHVPSGDQFFIQSISYRVVFDDSERRASPNCAFTCTSSVTMMSIIFCSDDEYPFQFFYLGQDFSEFLQYFVTLKTSELCSRMSRLACD